MTRLYFKVKLISDVILNQKAASEGPNATLDFIPGANFMGIVAGKFYKEIEEKKANGIYSDDDYTKKKAFALEIFHSGKVRFGDAHLGIEGDEEKGTRNIRGCKVPAALFYPKLKKPSEKLYVSHLIPDDENTKNIIRGEQLKQCRSGFYYFTQDKYQEIKSNVAFAIKSAHDRKNRTSKDSQMYGYQSLCAGAVMYFCVETEDKYDKLITSYLTTGSARIGRSRSAQYGLVEIKRVDGYEQICSNQKNGTITVYADSRLIFIDDETGMPTFAPTAKAFGLTTGRINWGKSQIRTFKYSPWNFKRQAFDTDRCGFEKGSVFVIDAVEDCPQDSLYVGFYKNEGFGRVIFNPSFLEGDLGTGCAKCLFDESEEPPKGQIVVEEIYNDDSALVKFLKQAYFDEQDEQTVYRLVNNWVRTNAKKFKKEVFASQWGTIRQIATQFKTAKEIRRELFDKVVSVTKPNRFGEMKKDTENKAYLTHGVAKDKWKGERLDSFRNFCNDTLADMNDKYFRFAIINLAAEMAKRCKKEESK